MLSKAKQQFIKSLHTKKNREDENLFIAEGEKVVYELLQSDYEIHSVYGLDEWISGNSVALKNIADKVFEITQKELESVSTLTNPNKVLAIAQRGKNEIKSADFSNQLMLALDNINDPGNFGTIVRLSDWFGINTIVCSNNCVELYNPKCIQAAMGSAFRVHVFYTDLETFFENYIKDQGNFIYGTFLNGDDIYKSKLHSKGIIVIGNESHGISEKLLPLISNRLTIPSFNSQADSLNAAVATGIILSEFRRRMDVAL